MHTDYHWFPRGLLVHRITCDDVYKMIVLKTQINEGVKTVPEKMYRVHSALSNGILL